MRIVLEFVRHDQQRRGEIGDWFFDAAGNLTVRVTDLGDWRYNFLFARHEMDEAMLCMSHGITTEMVDDDDDNKSPEDNADSFSGYPNCCYQAQHNDALAAEWVMSRLLDVDWKAYAAAVKCVEEREGVK